jgi:hypothetical protein
VGTLGFARPTNSSLDFATLCDAERVRTAMRTLS